MTEMKKLKTLLALVALISASATGSGMARNVSNNASTNESEAFGIQNNASNRTLTSIAFPKLGSLVQTKKYHMGQIGKGVEVDNDGLVNFTWTSSKDLLRDPHFVKQGCDISVTEKIPTGSLAISYIAGDGERCGLWITTINGAKITKWESTFVPGVYLSPYSNRLLLQTSDSMVLLDTLDGKELWSIKLSDFKFDFGQKIEQVTFSSDGEIVCVSFWSANAKRGLHLVFDSKGVLLHKDSGYSLMVISEDGKHLYGVKDERKREVRTLDLEKLSIKTKAIEWRRRIAIDENDIEYLRLGWGGIQGGYLQERQGRLVLSIHWSTNVYGKAAQSKERGKRTAVFSKTVSKPAITLFLDVDGNPVGQLPTGTGRNGAIECLRWSPNFKYFVKTDENSYDLFR